MRATVKLGECGWLDRKHLRANRWWESLKKCEKCEVTGCDSDADAWEMWKGMDRQGHIEMESKWKDLGLHSNKSVVDTHYLFEFQMGKLMRK